MARRLQRGVWDVVVIGGGIAGLTAALHAVRRGLTTALVEAHVTCGGQVGNVNMLEDWPAAGESSGVALAAALVEQVQKLGVEIIHQPVRGLVLDGDRSRVETEVSTLRARCTIVASGGKLRTLAVPGEEALRGKGVSQCAHCDGPFFRNQDVVVVGGGDAALQEALVLADLCRSVVIIARSALRAKRAYIDRAVDSPNLRFIWDSVVEAVLGDQGVTGVRLRHVKDATISELACSGVFAFVGTEPNTAFLPPSVTSDKSGRIITDYEFRTAVPSVFAVGAVRSGYSGELISATGEAAAAVATIRTEIAG